MGLDPAEVRRYLHDAAAGPLLMLRGKPMRRLRCISSSAYQAVSPSVT